MKLRIKPIVAACALAMAAGQAGAVDFYLAAKAYDKTLPDGTVVPMWGYVLDPDIAGDVDGDGIVEGDCFETTPAAARVTCINNLAAPSGVVGPRLTIPPTDSTFRIFLTNGLPEPTSIVIPGQELPHSALSGGLPDNGPTWNDGTRGSRGGDLTKKLRSYGREANADGGRRAFVWRNSRNNPISGTGSLIYHTGTWPQKQLYMGLYGLVTKDAAPGVIYDFDPNTTGDEVSYSSDTTLFYSDIDPAFNAAVSTGTLETAIDRHPSWFLINGEPYVQGTTPDITGLATNQPNLIRFASATTEKHVPVMQGLYGTIHAEDGIQYNWQDSAAGTATPAPIQQYSIGLPPLKTKDVIVSPAATGRYAVYDGNGYMTNPSDPDNPAVGDTVGGMLRFINIAQGTNQAPVTVPDLVEIVIPEDDTTPVSADVSVLANDFDPEGVTLGLLDSTAQFAGTNITVDLNCVAATSLCTATATPSLTDPWASPVVTDLAYTATDFDAGTADTAGTVTVTVVQNLIPVLTDDALAADTVTPTNFNLYTDLVQPNDTDAEGDVLTVTAVDAAPTNLGVVDCPDLVTGDCTYTPPATLPATIPFDETFTYTVSDGVNLITSPTATVTITVDAIVPVDPAVAVDDTYPATEDTQLLVDALTGLLANDTASGGGALDGSETVALVAGSGPANAAAFNLNPDGSFDYTPAADFNGIDSFQYVVDNGAESLPATVTIDVAAVNDQPVANADAFAVGESAILDEVAPGVLANDTDVDTDPLTAVLVTGPSCGVANTFVLNADGSFHYEPIPGWNSTLDVSNTLCPGVTGDDSFTYMANDGTDNSATVTVNITVTPRTAPTAVDDTIFLEARTLTDMTNEGELLNVTYVTASVLGNDLGAGTNPLVTEVNDPENITPTIAANGEVTMEIDNEVTGIVGTLDYQFSNDLGILSNTAQVVLIRRIAVKRSEFNLREDGGLDGNPANDDWRLDGTVDASAIPVGSEVYAYIIRQGVAPIPINTTPRLVTGGGNWVVDVENVGTTGPRPDIDTNTSTTTDMLRIEAHVVNPDTTVTVYTYDNVPIHIQN